MVFTSYIFLFAFLPLFLLAYAATPERSRSLTILAFSLLFYGWWRVEYLLLLAACLLATWIACRLMTRASDDRLRRLFLTIGICADVGMLLYFKYANLAVDTMNEALAVTGVPPIAWIDVVLPVGLSFFTFQAISYLVDVYRGTADEARGFVDFAAYITMFPQLIAGPIVRFHDVALQLRERTHSIEKFSYGSFRFMVGFSKKVLIADAVAPLATVAFALESPSLGDALLGLVAYTTQLYFDFSGYSDMAVGLGLMIGFEFPENFNSPYIASSITDFWRRWHMTLSAWLREYIYIPLGGNRSGLLGTRGNLLLTMLIGGLWHGAAWTFLVWGAWHGVLLILERMFPRLATPGPLNVARTSLLVLLGWVVFRAESLTQALNYYHGLLGLNGVRLSPELAWQLSVGQITFALIAFSSLWLYPMARVWLPRPNQRLAVATACVCFVWSVAALAVQSYRPFLYYQF